MIERTVIGRRCGPAFGWQDDGVVIARIQQLSTTSRICYFDRAIATADIGSGFLFLLGNIGRGATNRATGIRRGDADTPAGTRTEQREHAACLDDDLRDKPVVAFGKFCIGTRVKIENLRANTQDGTVVRFTGGKSGA